MSNWKQGHYPQKTKADTKKKNKNRYIILFVVAVIVIGVSLFSGEKSQPQNETVLASNEMTDDMKLKVISYAQTILDDKLSEAKYSFGTDGYTVIRTQDVYKVEGKVNNEEFFIRLRWDYLEDEYFDALYLQVGETTYFDVK